jgi:YidC/Oxa1 family membrane protein insertase
VILAGITNALDPLEHVMHSILTFLHTSTGLPWSWSIVVLTLLVRIVLVPLTVRQIHSMQALQAHAPQMKELQKKYKGDRQKLNEELMKFYKENNINPAASCLPMVAQLPVFFALYLTLKHSTRCATNAKDCIDGSWLHVVPDISDKASQHWAGWVLLCVYAGSQVASTYFMGTTMDKTQRRIMMVLPLAFLTVISRFPMGLTLYWMTTNLWTVGQGLVTRRLVPKTPAPATGGGRSSRTPPKSEDGGGASNGKSDGTTKQQAPKRQQQPRTQRRKRGGARR